MSEWITDRRPTEEDADYFMSVWTTASNGKVVLWEYDEIVEGQPWMRIIPPEPYVKPKRWTVIKIIDGIWWGICDNDIGRVMVPHLPTREAAERIAAIYEEVMP